MLTIDHRWTTTRTRSTCREISPLSIFPTGNFSTEGSILTSGGDHQRQPICTKCEEPFRPFSVEVAVSFDSWLLLSKIGWSCEDTQENIWKMVIGSLLLVQERFPHYQGNFPYKLKMIPQANRQSWLPRESGEFVGELLPGLCNSQKTRLRGLGDLGVINSCFVVAKLYLCVQGTSWMHLEHDYPMKHENTKSWRLHWG